MLIWSNRVGIAGRTVDDDIQIYDDAVNFSGVSEVAVRFSVLRIHDTHGGEGCAGCDGNLCPF